MLQLTASGSQGPGHRLLFPHVVKLLASSDLITKKLAAWYIAQTTQQEDLLLLAVNTLLKDCIDPNPMVRGLALRTLCGLPQTDLLQYAIQPVSDGLKDRSAYVRRVAVTGCIKISKTNRDLLLNYGLVDSLYSMIRDPDPLVVANSLCSLEEILRDEGGVVINKNMAHYLLNRVGMLTDWGLVVVLEKLQKYQPNSEEEALDIMNLVDNCLKHNNSAVVMNAIHFFLVLIRNLPHLRSEVFSRAKGQVLHCLSAGNPELTYMLLCFVESVIDDNKVIFQENFRTFFCKYNEPLYVKKKKIEMLPCLATLENMSEMLEEISMYCSDVTPTLSKYAITAVGQIASEMPQFHASCVKKLVKLIEMDIDYVTSNVLQVLKCLDFSENGSLEEILPHIPKCVDIVTSEEGKSSIWWFIGEYGEQVDEAPYMMESFVENDAEEASVSVRLQLMTAAMKLFFKRPGETQDVLGRVLELCASGNDFDVRDRALWYYNLLQTDVQLAQTIVGHPHPRTKLCETLSDPEH